MHRRIGRYVLSHLYWLLPLLVVATAYRESASYDFVADARFLIPDNHFLRLDLLWPNLTRDYFWSSSGASIPYWRPLTKLSWLLEWQVFERWAGGYHLVTVLWHACGVLGIMYLGRGIGLSKAGAAGAGLLYGLHAAAIEPTCLIMARSDVVSTVGIIWSVATFVRLRAGKFLGGHILSVVVALASKESAVIIAPLLALWAWIPGTRGSPRESTGKLLPSIIATVVYLATRSWILRDDIPAAISLDGLRIFVAGGEYLSALLPFRLDTGLRNLARIEAQSLPTIFAAAASFALLLVILGWSWRRDANACALVGWILLSLAPVLMAQIAVPNIRGKLPIADRWLLPAAAAASLLYPLLAQRLGLLARRVTGATCLLWAAFAWIAAPVAHGAYANEGALMEKENERFLMTPERFRTDEDICRSHSRRMITALVQDDVEAVIEVNNGLPKICQADPGFRFNLFSALVRAGRMKEARLHVDALLSDAVSAQTAPRFRPTLWFLCGITLLETGEWERADQLLEQASAMGFSDCQIHKARAAVARARGKIDMAIVHRNEYERCRQ